LKPALINSGDYLDLSHRATITIIFPESRPKQPAARPTALLIYHHQPITGPFRFRTILLGFRTTIETGMLHLWKAASASVSSRMMCHPLSSFLHGHDLLVPSGLPRQIILPQIACAKRDSRICDQLLHENLATPAQFSRCRNLASDHRMDSELTLLRLSQEFPVNFSCSALFRSVVAKARHELRFSHLLQSRSELNFYTQ
jgi:hypothetical protein